MVGLGLHSDSHHRGQFSCEELHQCGLSTTILPHLNQTKDWFTVTSMNYVRVSQEPLNEDKTCQGFNGEIILGLFVFLPFVWCSNSCCCPSQLKEWRVRPQYGVHSMGPNSSMWLLVGHMFTKEVSKLCCVLLILHSDQNGNLTTAFQFHIVLLAFNFISYYCLSI